MSMQARVSGVGAEAIKSIADATTAHKKKLFAEMLAALARAKEIKEQVKAIEHEILTYVAPGKYIVDNAVISVLEETAKCRSRVTVEAAAVL